MSLNLVSVVFESAKRFAAHPAVLHDSGVWTHAELAKKTCRFANALQNRDIGPGDRVALMAPNIPQFTVAYFGILATGAIVVPIHIQLTGKEVGFCLRHSGASALIFWEGVSEAATKGMAQIDAIKAAFCIGSERVGGGGVDGFERALETSSPIFEPFPTMPDDTAVIFYTSGTTGSPKGAELTHFNLFSNAQWVSECSLATACEPPERWGPGHVALAVLPLSHSFAQTCMQNAPLMHGGALGYLMRFEAHELLRKMAQYRVSGMAIVPRIVRELLRVPDIGAFDLTAFRYALVGGAPIDMGDIDAFETRFGAEVLEGYGLSETSPVIAFRTPATPRSPGSVGRPIRGVRIRIVDDSGKPVAPGCRGEITVQGQAVMKGYYRNPEATAETLRAGWLYTGDIGFMDEADRVYIVDRKKDTIIRSGFSVYPIEVEEVLRAHPDVVDAAVVGVADETHGEEIKAIVVGKARVDDLIAHCRSQLAAYKCPRIFEFRTELPRGIKGQVLRRLLK